MNINRLPSNMQTKVREEFGCWIWTAAKNARGYGSVGVGGNKSKLAHRHAYETIRGPIPHGLTIDHLCARKQCVNPWHMEPVTLSENSRRGDHGVTEPRIYRGPRLSNSYVDGHLVWSCPYAGAIGHYPELVDPVGWAARVDAMNQLGSFLAAALAPLTDDERPGA